MPGRPSSFTQDIADEIVERLSKGEPLAVMCRDPYMPDRVTVWRWAEADKTFSQHIARAREDGFDMIANETRLISRGVPGESSGDVQRDKLIIDTDLKLLAKWDPKRYGERQEVDVNHGVQDSLGDLLKAIDGRSRAKPG